MESSNFHEENTLEFWLESEITKQNIFKFLEFMKHKFPQHEVEFEDFRKKINKKNRNILSLAIVFARTIDKKDENLVFLTKKFIQAIMNNPKGLK